MTRTPSSDEQVWGGGGERDSRGARNRLVETHLLFITSETLVLSESRCRDEVELIETFSKVGEIRSQKSKYFT